MLAAHGNRLYSKEKVEALKDMDKLLSHGLSDSVCIRTLLDGSPFP